MNSIDITISVIVCIVGLAIGLFFGLLPIKTDNMTEEQNKWQQFAAVIGIGLVLALTFAQKDFASWVIIIAMLVGVIIAKIPYLHRLLLSHFPFFRPKKHHSPLTKTTKRK